VRNSRGFPQFGLSDLRRTQVLYGSALSLILSLMAPIVGVLADVSIKGQSLTYSLTLRLGLNLFTALVTVVCLYLLIGWSRVDPTRPRDLILVGILTGLILFIARVGVLRAVYSREPASSTNWIPAEASVVIVFAVLLILVLLLVAQRERLSTAERLLSDEARRALHDDSELLRARVFDHLHGTVQSELLVARIRLVDVAEEVSDPETAEALRSIAARLLRVHETQVRAFAHSVVGEGIDAGLADALAVLTVSMEDLCEVTTSISDEFIELERSTPIEISAPAQLAMYRIIEECLVNAIRHGRARNAEVRVDLSDGNRRGSLVEITVSNDGGMPATAAADGAGMRMMRVRASAYRGTVQAEVVEDRYLVRALLEWPS
jgi:signal transduction histidine kinase